MRNNFLGLILVSLFLIPTISFAKVDVPGDTTQSLNSNSSGSYYIGNKNNTLGNVMDATFLNYLPAGAVVKQLAGKDEAYFTLHNSNQRKIKITSEEFDALKIKLKEDGSPASIVNNLTIDNVTVRNTDDVTMYVYDRTMNDAKNNDSVYIGYATKRGEFYTDLKTPIVESNEGNQKLDIIDQAQGRPAGTTINRKNLLTNTSLEEKLSQEKLSQATAELDAAKKELEDAQKSGDPARIAAAQARLAEATKNATLAQNAYNASASASQAAQNAATASAQPGAGIPSCDSILSLSGNNCILWWIAKMTNVGFKLVSFLAYVTGTLFDYSLELSINSAEFFKKLGVVEVTWAFIRDILNMSFIFILLWTAVQILIGNEAKYSAKKVLTNVIIVAILMNFSLFAAKLMVDGSNIVSLKIYEAMKSNTESKNATISERVMNTVGLSTLYNVQDILKTDKIQAEGYCATNPAALITISVMGSIFLIILCLALGLAAILFLVRLVNIIFLFIKSPLWVWGYVMPGNSSISRFKDEWWAEMKHVLIFPIAYLFWMLVAVIVFEKLGTVKTVSADGTAVGGVSLLDLICNGPGAGGIGQSISLVAIFGIVIIFMMKAIEYGVKKGVGAPTSLGNDISKKWANKFSGYQTAMTQGLMKKTAKGVGNVASYGSDAAVRASVGAAKVPLRVATGIAGAKTNIAKGEKGWEGFKDGYLNSSIKTKEVFRDMARNQAVNGGAITDLLGINRAAAKLAVKYDDPKNSAGETKKQADERRSKGAVEDETNMYKAIDKTYKVQTQKDWLKKNPTGTNEDYEEYVVKKMTARTDALLGAGISGKTSTNGKSHIENLRAATLTRYMEDKKDEYGVVMKDDEGKAIKVERVRFNEHAMHKALPDIIEHHTTGAGTEALKIGKEKFTTFRNIKAKARIKAISDQVKKDKNSTQRKEAVENEIKAIEKAIEKIQDLPPKDKIESFIERKAEYTEKGSNEKTIRDINKAIIEVNAAGTDIVRLENAKRKLAEAKASYLDHVEKKSQELVKKQAELARKIKAQEDEANKPK